MIRTRVADNKKTTLNPTVLKLGLVSFFADVSSEMLYPITPIFLTTVLGASMASVGLVEGCAEAAASLLKGYSGAWSDRLGARRPFVLGGYLIAALAKPLTAFTGSWPQVLFVRSLDRVGKGLRTAPRDAMLADAASKQTRGSAFGWHRAMDSAGAALGPLLALIFLSNHANDLRKIYLWALIPGLASALLVFTVRERKIPAKQKPAIGRATATLSWKETPISSWKETPIYSWKETPPAFKRYLAVWGLFSLANSSDVFLLMRAKQAGFALTTVVLFYCLYNCIYSLLSPYFGGLSDRWGRREVLASGLVVFALVYGGFAMATAAWHFWVLFAAYGLFTATTDGVGKALAVDLVPKGRKATAVGALGTVTGLASIFASVVAGLLWDHAGHAWPFVYGMSGAIAAALLLWFGKSASSAT